VIALPFWLVVPFDITLLHVEKVGGYRPPVAFCSAENMARFLERDGKEQWYVRLVTRSTISSLLDELQRREIAEIHFTADCPDDDRHLSLGEIREQLKL